MFVYNVFEFLRVRVFVLVFCVFFRFCFLVVFVFGVFVFVWFCVSVSVGLCVCVLWAVGRPLWDIPLYDSLQVKHVLAVGSQNFAHLNIRWFRFGCFASQIDPTFRVFSGSEFNLTQLAMDHLGPLKPCPFFFWVWGFSNQRVLRTDQSRHGIKVEGGRTPRMRNWTAILCHKAGKRRQAGCSHVHVDLKCEIIHAYILYCDYFWSIYISVT